MATVLRVITFADDASALVAQEQGFFAREGLQVETTHTPSSTFQMQGLSDGTFQVAFTAFDNVLAWSGRAGAEIVAVARVQAPLALSVWARPEVPSFAALRGRRLAADAVDTAFALVLRRVLLSHGLDLPRGDYELVAVGATGLRLESLRRGETDAAVLNPPWDSQAAAAGLVKLADVADMLPKYPGGTSVAVARDWAAAHRAQVVGFLRAWKAGGRWAHAHTAETTSLLARRRGVPPETLHFRPPSPALHGTLDRESLEEVLRVRTSLGLTPTLGADLDRYLAPEYLAAAGA